MRKYYIPWPNSPSSTGEPRGTRDYQPPSSGGHLHGAKNISLSEDDVKYILEHVHRAKEIIQKHDLPEETILLNHLNSIGAKLVN